MQHIICLKKTTQNFIFKNQNDGNYLLHVFFSILAPPNAEGFKSVDQNETSITLQWKQVDGINTYTLAYGAEEINVTASEGQEETSYTVPGLTSGVRYDFILYSLFGNVRSSGEPLSAVTGTMLFS